MGEFFAGIICKLLFNNSFFKLIKGKIELPIPAKIAFFTASLEVSYNFLEKLI